MSTLVVRQAFFRLELNDALRSRWLVFTAAVYALVFTGFIWLGLRESSVLGFTGLSRVVLNMANAVALVVPLVALVASSSCVVRARQSGFFELMLSQPARRSDWLASNVASRFLVVVGPLALLFVGALVAGPFVDAGDRELTGVVARSLATTAALAWAFLGIGFWISAGARSPERATVLALLAWLASSALHDFALVGALLRYRARRVEPGRGCTRRDPLGRRPRSLCARARRLLARQHAGSTAHARRRRRVAGVAGHVRHVAGGETSRCVRSRRLTTGSKKDEEGEEHEDEFNRVRRLARGAPGSRRV